MSLAEIKEVENGRLGIWKLEDSSQITPETFPFSENEKKEFQTIKNNRRKKEYLAVRLLLQEMTGTKQEILHDKNGKPKLKDSLLHISISHSASLAVILLSNNNAGVDAENIRRKIQPIAPRFLSKKELCDLNQAGNPQLSGILYWCAKEAVFKFSDLSEIDFKTHIAVFPFNIQPEGGKFYGELRKEKPVVALTFSYFFFANNVVVYCVEELKDII